MEILRVDRTVAPRLLLGALSEHEQRLLVIRLLRGDEPFRTTLLPYLEVFEMFDRPELEEYSAVLASIELDAEGVAESRREVLGRSFGRAGDLDGLIRDLTYPELMHDPERLAEKGGHLFTWSMAERLLERSRLTSDAYRSTSYLYLALMVIDVVDLLGASGHGPDASAVAADVRRRIRRAEKTLATRFGP